jgi:hypothetical protein
MKSNPRKKDKTLRFCFVLSKYNNFVITILVRFGYPWFGSDANLSTITSSRQH